MVGGLNGSPQVFVTLAWGIICRDVDGRQSARESKQIRNGNLLQFSFELQCKATDNMTRGSGSDIVPQGFAIK